MTKQETPIRAAIIGYGGSGKLSHADVIRQLPEFEIRAICDVSGKQRSKARKDLNCDVYDSVESLLVQASDFELVIVVTRTDTHCPIVLQCLNAGLHTVVTKPWAINRQEADLMLAAQERSGKMIFPWMPMAWSHEYTKIKEIIDSGAIGEIFLVRRHITHFWKREDWQTQTRYGGGYLLNWGMHIVQPVLNIVSSTAIRVFGQLQQVVNPGDAEDNFLSIIEFENGARGIAEFTQSVEGLPSFMVQGSLGMIQSDGKSITLIKKDPASNAEPLRQTFPIEGNRFGDEHAIYRDIAASIRQSAPIKASTREAYYGSIVLDAIRESHLQRQVIDISESTRPLFQEAIQT